MIEFILGGAWQYIATALGIAGAFLWVFIAGGKREKNKRVNERLDGIKAAQEVEKEIADADKSTVVDINTRD